MSIEMNSLKRLSANFDRAGFRVYTNGWIR
jgi:hypothetical protein